VPGRPPLRVALLALGLLAGCTPTAQEPPAAPLFVPVASADAASVDACRRLTQALPEEVDPGVGRREVASDPARTAAWGDPPVTLECGVPDPERPEEPVIVNGVPWSVRDIGPGFRWTSREQRVNVAVEIPDAYPSGAEIVNPISTAIVEVLGR
jgi:hypothetical protein